jgi:putative flippase GtrA
MRQFIRYSSVGAVATAVHYLVLVACVEYVGLAPWLASGLGAATGAQIAFLGNRWYTFVHNAEIRTSWLRFQATALVGALIGMAVVAVSVRLGLHYLLAQMLATGLMLVLTFLINRAWTFR